MVKGVHFVSNFCNLLHPLGLLEHLLFELWTLSANTLTVQLVSTTRQRSGWLSQPGFESRHHLLKTKIRGTSLPLVESFFLIMNYKLFPWCFSPNCDFAGTRYGTTETRVRGWISAVAFMTQSRMSILSLMRVALLRLGSSLSLDFLSF